MYVQLLQMPTTAAEDRVLIGWMHSCYDTEYTRQRILRLKGRTVATVDESECLVVSLSFFVECTGRCTPYVCMLIYSAYSPTCNATKITFEPL